MDEHSNWALTPHPSAAGERAPAWGQPEPALFPRRRRQAPHALGASALALAITGNGIGILGVFVGVFCVGFIAAFGAPLEVTEPAMAGFAVWGSLITAPFFVAAVTVLVVGIVRRGWSAWWVAPIVINSATLLGLWIASLLWFHPGVPVSWGFG